MFADIENKQDTLIVRLRGEIDLVVADNLRKELDDVLDKEASKNLLLNLKGVYFIDSSGLGVLLGRYKKVSRNGGKVFIVSPQPQVRKILDLSGLLRIMGEYSSEEEALEKIV